MTSPSSTLPATAGTGAAAAAELADTPLIGNEIIAPELIERIRVARERAGEQVVILGHHYQRDEVIQFADRSGDSLDLSIFAAGLKAKYVIFCGVHFMAETADIVSASGQTVILPDVRAGCSMADMAQLHQVEDCWAELAAATPERIVPVTYINSSAQLKGFVGRHDGAVCTSSNAAKIVKWAFERGEKVLFFPDQHLGRNTAAAMGIPLEKMVVYNPHEPGGGNAPEAYADAKVILWRGHCSVHQNFRAVDPPFWRKKVPGIRILVHPECRYEVVQQADIAGSTKKIVETIDNAPAGSKWAVGTEHHLVNRLKKRHPEQFITSLAPFACQCSTMFRISPENLCESLEAIVEDRVTNPERVRPETERWWRVVKVDAETAKWSRIALDRMMQNR